MPLPPDLKFNFRVPIKAYQQLRANLLGDSNYGHFHGSLRDGIFVDDPYQDFVHRVYDMLDTKITLDDPDEVDGDYVHPHVDAVAPFKKLMLSYYGSVMNVEHFNNMLWRVGAGLTQFQAGVELQLAFPIGAQPMWLPLWVEDIHSVGASKKGSAMLSVKTRVLDGVYAGLAATHRIPQKWWTNILAREIGFPLYNRDGPTHYNELTQCVFAGYLAFDDERFGPRMAEFGVTGAMKTFNQKLRKLRREPCPREYRHWCHRCHAGHGLGDSTLYAPPCPRATHSFTHVEMPCPRCKRLAMFDTGAKSLVCVRCADKENNQRVKVSG